MLFRSRDVFRGYLPEPGIVAVEFQSQLRDNLGIDVEVVVMESGEFIDESTNGRLDGFYLLGWGADYPHVTNFLDFHFSASNPQYVMFTHGVKLNVSYYYDL